MAMYSSIPRPIWRRHPRYTLSVLVIIVTTVLFLSPFQTSAPGPAPAPAPASSATLGDAAQSENDYLSTRLELSETIYHKIVQARQGLIRKFGPTPSEVAMFPANKDPWPAYTVWDFFPPAFNCPHELERIGALGDGGKWTCGLSRIAEKPDCVVYSFGTNYESSFEKELIARTHHCHVYAYDATPGARGPRVDRAQQHRVHFQRVGLAAIDAHGPQDSPKAHTLETLMAANGHAHIDVLKVDVEGWEFDIMTSIVKPYVLANRSLPFGQLNLEMHVWNKGFADFLAWWEMLEAGGLRPFMYEPNLIYQNYNKESNQDLAEYSFLNTKGTNAFISHASSPPSTKKLREDA
ncbi:hypothetical protein FIBSPDRAFT_904496 [Athelia psychrophila]|uniref:Methyltransferase domain-containing protein n=1 Tax=Athelia psychrophila TaxID=1759441 RepID=A0A167UP76_9AGAM|nr:hypothetical protein FIBSPDRAFT_904496 [Fibularhizoctonia sp. CBS 109695]